MRQYPKPIFPVKAIIWHPHEGAGKYVYKIAEVLPLWIVILLGYVSDGRKNSEYKNWLSHAWFDTVTWVLLDTESSKDLTSSFGTLALRARSAILAGEFRTSHRRKHCRCGSWSKRSKRSKRWIGGGWRFWSGVPVSESWLVSSEFCNNVESLSNVVPM